MKNNFKKTSIIILFILILAVPDVKAQKQFSKFNNEEYGYSILLPQDWKINNIDFKYKHILLIQKNVNTEIKITVTEYSDQIKEQWKNWERWYLNDIGSGLKKIIENDKITIQKDITGTLSTFEYETAHNKILARLIFIKFNNNVMIIECKAPIKSFPLYNHVFDMVINSLEFGS